MYDLECKTRKSKICKSVPSNHAVQSNPISRYVTDERRQSVSKRFTKCKQQMRSQKVYVYAIR